MDVPKATDDELKIKLTPKEKKQQNKKNLNTFNFRVIIACAILFYILYMFCETTSSYNIQRYVSDNIDPTGRANLIKTSIRCAGLLSLTEGVTRAFSSVFICTRVKFRHFLTVSLLILIGAFAFTLTK